MKRLIGTGLIVASTLFVAGCGDSPEDNAREAGEKIGDSLHTIRTSSSAQDAGKAIDAIKAQIATAKEELPTAFDEELTAIQDQFAQDAQAAADPTALRGAYLDAAAQLNSLQSNTNSVVNEFRRGVREGLSGE